MSSASDKAVRGRVVQLDRGLPLVRFADGSSLRCEHATALVKAGGTRAVIGDYVFVAPPSSHDQGVIESICPRVTQLVRRDPAERTLPQVLAANFDLVIVAEPLAAVNERRLERALVVAHETGARVAVVLTKADLADLAAARETVARVRELAGDVPVEVVSAEDAPSIERVRALIGPGQTGVLIGKSGVGKSRLVNLLAGDSVRRVGEVRASDGKGRHTTVSRAIVPIPQGGWVVDMPGMRGLGLWDARAGIPAAFPDVTRLAAQCRFRDCRHEAEPGCAVRRAVESGELSAVRVASYQALVAEHAQVEQDREQARQLLGEKRARTRRRPGGQRGKRKRS